jgi:cytochrome P450
MMTTEDLNLDAEDQKAARRIDLDRHSTTYRTQFEELAGEFHGRCPVAWNEAHEGYWFVSGNEELFDIARRADVLSNDNDIHDERRGYRGITIPSQPKDQRSQRGGFLEMDPPAQRHYRQALNPYLSPAAVARWQPFLDEITRACIDEKIESGRIDFVDDLANIVPAVFTLAMLGIPLKEWEIYCEPVHASVYTPPSSPDFERVREISMVMGRRTMEHLYGIRQTPRPGLIDALINADIVGEAPSDEDVLGAVMLLIGGGFDTTTALTAHSLEWLSENPDQRARLAADRDTLLNPATEEFLRYYTPAVGDGRTVCADAEINGVQFREGERLWLSWAMSNRDPKVFEDPNTIHLDRKGNRHSSFGLGIHRCIGSNVARTAFKTMLGAVLDRMPDFVCDKAGADHYPSTGIINGMRKLPATFTPGERLSKRTFEETLELLQKACDEQRLAEPVTRHRGQAQI